MPLTWDEKINKNTAWGGDKSTFGRPVSGRRIEEWIKESLGNLENSEGERNINVQEKLLELTLLQNDLELQASEMHDELYDRVPIYSLDLLDRKPKDIEKYLIVPSSSDLDGQSTNNIVTTINGTYIELLFRSIRALLSEVAKLKNSFKFGINSYIDDNTAMSEAVHDIEEPDEEPLWAVDPEALSFVDLVSIDENHTLLGLVDSGTKGVLKVISSATWKSSEVLNNTDNKLIFYLTVSNPNIILIFEDLNNNTLTLNLLEIIKSYSLQDIMIIVSRETELGGKNYIYINSNNKNLDEEIISGYYTGSAILSTYPNYITLNLKFKLLILNQLNIYNLNVYSKYLDFSNLVIPTKPNDSSYKMEAAHITIRSVKTYDVLKELAKYLLDSELVYCKGNRRLYIIDNGRILSIGGTTSDDDNGMTQAELITELEKMGIVTLEDSGNLSLNKISDVTFINDDTGKNFKITIDAYGLFKIDEVYTNTLESRMDGRIFLDQNIRGFVATLKGLELSIGIKKDFGLYGDRIKIGAIYAPLSTDTIFGCTHGYIELENTSDEDFPLEGCYLHMCQNHPIKGIVVYHLALHGIIPKGGTYLIRCKKYAEPSDKNVFINVNSFDIEWYLDGELLDLTIYFNKEMGFALTYQLPDLDYNMYLCGDSTSFLLSFGLTTDDHEAFPYVYNKYFIDSIYLGEAFQDSGSRGYWASKNAMPIKSNSIYKNTFELDPAKQAFLATTGKESSRIRWANAKTDYLQLSLNNEYIEFPNSNEIFPIKYFSPKASFEHKNVCTDKTKLDVEKPNMVTCAFGINMYTTRCFNWISGGLFDEYVFIKQGNNWVKFESYKEGDGEKTQESGALKRKEFNENIINCIYKRMTGRFPAANTQFTSHKCIINITSLSVSAPTTYTYVVGRADKNGNPDFEHCSDEYAFTLYPESYTPVIYQITDLQGFHWIEYLVWAAAAKEINNKIESDKLNKNIIPILINTGDMTQNGTRINEWLDYYNAGKCLFNHLELMNVVGNNDLCGTNPWILGTGDDIGKSNSFYFHLFYCYEINQDIAPIVNEKYIPSLYYFDSKDNRYLMVNSELTYENCANWYNLRTSDNVVVNIYTGFSIPISSDTVQRYAANELNFTPIYDLLYLITDTNKKITGACHELPFTVITRDSLKSTSKLIFRSISNANKLVGSHLNLLCPEDNKKGIHWFSRLMEYRGVKLVIGGHKHTYACTYPVRENYQYGNFNSINGPMPMESTLENDNVEFIINETNYSKLPLTKRRDIGQPVDTSSFYPYTPVENLTGGVIYFMCLATGYKLTSNKELPSPDLKFSRIIPNTGIKDGKDTADVNQKYPMFSIIDNNGIKLLRIMNILDNSNSFSQISFGKNSPTFLYLTEKESGEDNYGNWGDSENYLIELT